MCKRRLWKWASLFIGAPLGNLECGLFSGNSKRQMKEGSGNGAFCEGNMVEGSFSGNP